MNLSTDDDSSFECHYYLLHKLINKNLDVMLPLSETLLGLDILIMWINKCPWTNFEYMQEYWQGIKYIF